MMKKFVANLGRPEVWLVSGLMIGIVALSTYAAIMNVSHFGDGAYGNNQTIQTDTQPELIDLQGVVDEWVARQRGRVAVELYDLDHQRVVGEFQADKMFGSASLYKLFVVYADYMRVSNNEVMLGVESEALGLDKKFLLVGGKYLTRADCLDLAIRQSDSPCAERLVQEIGWEKILTKMQGVDVSNPEIESYTTTAKSMNALLKVIYQHQEIRNDLAEKLFDSMLSQPKTLVGDGDFYDWRQGLPSGFSDNAKVYNKVGWDSSDDGKTWTIYNDAAIVEVGGHHYAMTILTENTNPRELRAFGAELEKAITN